MKVAVLKEKVLVRYRKARKEDKTNENQVLVPDDCDLKVGIYEWDGEKFVPIHPEKFPKKEDTPSAMSAIAYGLAAIQKTVPLPSETIDWLNWFRTTKDGIAPPPKKKPRTT